MNFDKKSISEKKKKNADGVGVGSVQTVKMYKLQNSDHLHNVGHVIQSTLQNV